MGTALLGTLLVSILIGSSRLQSQSARASRRIEACKAADALLEAWWDNEANFPRYGSGSVPGWEEWTWRTGRIQNPAADEWGGEVIAVEILAADPGGRGAGLLGEPLVRIEVILPAKRDEKAYGTDAD